MKIISVLIKTSDLFIVSDGIGGAQAGEKAF